MTFEEAVRDLMLKQPGTGKIVTPEELLAILKEDVVLTVERPGSWEGCNMFTVLESHGFFNRSSY